MLKSSLFVSVGQHCKVCLCRRATALVGLIHRNVHTTAPLQRVKRKQSVYRPKVPPFHYYGETHRLLRGASTTLDRYGPLFDKPDYTFLDGRPTPLTPEQKKVKEERKETAVNVMKYLKDMDTVKDFYQQSKVEQENAIHEIQRKKLKAKS